jgi:hypothetical protein
LLSFDVVRKGAAARTLLEVLGGIPPAAAPGHRSTMTRCFGMPAILPAPNHGAAPPYQQRQGPGSAFRTK